MKQYWLYSESKTSNLSFDEKKKALERYLNDLACNDAIATSEPFLLFIRGEDILDYSNKKMNTNNMSNINMSVGKNKMSINSNLNSNSGMKENYSYSNHKDNVNI
jgi:hypothetical protein